MKDSPFQSSYLTDFIIHEEQLGNRRLYPRTAELPLLARALRLEFEGALPPRIRRADKRADDFIKIQRKAAAQLFCNVVNLRRSDGLQLFALLDEDRVAQPAIVQYVFLDSDQGCSLSFKFYVSDGFYEEVRLCGRRLVFSKHAFERLTQRGVKRTGNTIKDLLGKVFSKPLVALPCGGDDGIGLFLPLEETIVALPIREGNGEFFIPTFLDIGTTYSFQEPALPTYPMNLHYGSRFTPPKIRNWNPVALIFQLKELWETKTKPPADKIHYQQKRWGDLAYMAPDLVKERGHGPGSRLVFLDNIPGPCSLDIPPGVKEPQFDELEHCRKEHPERNWVTILAKRDAMLTAS